MTSFEIISRFICELLIGCEKLALRFNFQESKQKSTDEHTENLKSTDRQKSAKSLFFFKFRRNQIENRGWGKLLNMLLYGPVLPRYSLVSFVLILWLRTVTVPKSTRKTTVLSIDYSL